MRELGELRSINQHSVETGHILRFCALKRFMKYISVGKDFPLKKTLCNIFPFFHGIKFLSKAFEKD